MRDLLKIKAKGIKRRLGHLAASLFDRSPKIVVLTYHRVLPEVVFDPFRSIVSRAGFLRQIEKLAVFCDIVSLDDIASSGGSATTHSKTRAILTFDDGYSDSYETVFPILKAKGLQAAFFVSTDYVGANLPLWEWEAMAILYVNGQIDKVPIGDREVERRAFEPAPSFQRRVFSALRKAGREDLRKAVDFLRSRKTTDAVYDYSRDRSMTWEELGRLSSGGMAIGSHGRLHIPLTNMPVEEARYEISESKGMIEKNLGRPCRHFSFPFGSRRDYNRPLIDAVREAGYATCLLNVHGYNHAAKDLFALKRIVVDEETKIDCLLG